MKVFNELVANGCALRDIVTAIYFHGKHVAMGKPAPTSPGKANGVPVCPYDEILASYHAKLCDRDKDVWLPRVKSMDEPRRAVIRKFWVWIFTSTKIASDGSKSHRAANRAEGMAWINRYFDLVFEDDHTMGRGARGKGWENWEADLEYVIRFDCVKKIIEKTKQRHAEQPRQETAGHANGSA